VSYLTELDKENGQWYNKRITQSRDKRKRKTLTQIVHEPENKNRKRMTRLAPNKLNTTMPSS
jgi:ribulose bisphosphate carboxylase small subunit